MRTQRLGLLTVGLLAVLLAMPTAWAGQVVTQQERDWARQALANETALKAAQMPDNTLAVLYFLNTTPQTALDVLQKGLAVMLMTDLAKIDGLVLVERVKLQALVEEMGLGVSGLVDAGTAPRVGRLLGTRFLVGGNIAGSSGTNPSAGALDENAISRALDTRVQIDPKLLDVPAGQTTNLPGVEGLIRSLFQLEKELLFAIVQQLKISLTENQKTALRVPMTTNTRALFYFFMGLNASDSRQYERAGTYYEQATQADPSLKPAAKALKELRQLGLYGRSPNSRSLLRSVRKRTSLTDSLAPADAVKRVRTPADVTQRQLRNTPAPQPEPPVEIDNDGDGYTVSQGDCNDNDARINPGAIEDCTSVDFNCNGDLYDAPDGCY